MPELAAGLAAHAGRLEVMTVAGLPVGYLEENGLPVGPDRYSLNRLGVLSPSGLPYPLW